MHGFCHLSAVPCRREPSDKSEMVTQLLFGDTFTVTEEKGSWHHIVNEWDGYECWIDKKQYHRISDSLFAELKAHPAAVSSELFQLITNKTTGDTFPIPLGSFLPFLQNGEIVIDNNAFAFDGNSRPFDKAPERNEIIETALLFRNSPYLWGGRTAFGTDCSGFVQNVFKANGIRLKRDAYQQSEYGTACSFVEEAVPGDLAFFDNEEGRITHVGIVIDDNRIIHASGRVRIDHYDHYGIFTPERGGYTHNLRVIKSIL